MSANKTKEAIRKRDGNCCLLCGMTTAEHQAAYEGTLPVHRIVDPTWDECKPAFVRCFGGPKENFRSFGLAISDDGKLSRRVGSQLFSTPDPKWPTNIVRAFKQYQRWRESEAGYREDNCFTLCKKCHQDIHRIKDRVVSDINQAFLFGSKPNAPFAMPLALTRSVEQLFTETEFAVKEGRITGQMKELLLQWLRGHRPHPSQPTVALPAPQSPTAHDAPLHTL